MQIYDEFDAQLQINICELEGLGSLLLLVLLMLLLLLFLLLLFSHVLKCQHSIEMLTDI